MKKTVFILGAGFSKFAGYPLAAELGDQVIEDPTCLSEGRKEFSPDYIFDKAINRYNIEKDSIPFEELWINLEKHSSRASQATPEWWLLKYFSFAIRSFFLRYSFNLKSLPLVYNNFFDGFKPHPTIQETDALIYMNWDPLPEIYCGLCRGSGGKMKGSPFFNPVGASINHEEVKVPPGIPIYRPAGGVNLLEVKEGMEIFDKNRECFPITKDPNIYLETNLDPFKRNNLTLKAGELEYLIHPGAAGSDHPFLKGQLREAEKAIIEAIRIIVIGYRFPSYDKYMRDWIEGQDFSGKEIIVVKSREAFDYLSDIANNATIHFEDRRFEESSFSKKGWNN